jgi:hypothetical protein
MKRKTIVHTSGDFTEMNFCKRKKKLTICQRDDIKIKKNSIF